MLFPDGVIPEALDEILVGDDDPVNSLVSDLVQAAHQNYIHRSGVFGVDLLEDSFQVPHLGSGDALDVHVEDGLDIEVRDRIVESAGAEEKFLPLVLDLHTMNILADIDY